MSTIGMAVCYREAGGKRLGLLVILAENLQQDQQGSWNLLCLLDLSAAFNSTHHRILLDCLRELGPMGTFSMHHFHFDK